MVVGSYLITSTHMRIKDERGSKFFGPNVPLPKGPLTPASLKERVERVLQSAPTKLKTLIIVNSCLTIFDMIQACVEVADKYCDNVMVIPPLLALATFALEDVAKFRNPSPKEVIMIVTITSTFFDFVIFRRDFNAVMYVAEFEHFEKLKQFKEKFIYFYNHFYPHSTTLLVHDSIYNVAQDLKREFNPENCFIKTFTRYDFVLLFGGMLRAMDDQDGFDTSYHIANFSSGYETVTQYRQTFKSYILLKERSPLPCNIYGFNGAPGMINIFYSPEFYQKMGNQLVSTRRDATTKPVHRPGTGTFLKYFFFSVGSAEQVIGCVDERGIPYIKGTSAFKNRKRLKKEIEFKNQNPEKNEPAKEEQISSVPADDTGTILSLPTSSTANNVPQIKFLFRDNICAVEILQNGSSKFLTDSFGNKWIPSYLSMAESTVEIGGKAKSHFVTFPRHVIYDIFEVIEKPMFEIKINPKWGFQLIVQNGIVYFQIETLFGPRLFPQEMIIAAFLKSMKIQTESNLNVQVNEIHLSTHLALNESQKSIFIKAAAKNNLEILSFDVL
uniref:Uncharacterized protein n=1 Tax=Panagrolaimus sp. PS1159 TaxID=55785 RepID=A0AC35FBP1_9BILA